MRNSRSVAVAVVIGCAGAVSANVGPVPGATPIEGTGLCVVDGWEYAPRWSTPNNGFVSPSLEDCATQCEADPVCTGTTFIVSGSEKNCWFKDWGAGPAAPPCLPSNPNLVYQAIIDPAGNDCSAIEYMGEPTLDCEVESMIEEKPAALGPAEADAEGPAAAVPSTATDVATLTPLGYTGYPGVDYGPLQMPAPMVGIVDIGGGLLVADAAECAEACTADPTCNSASYYGDNPSDIWPAGDNCYLKTLTGCALPDDVEMKDDATIFIIGGTECEGAPNAAPIAPTLGAAAPLEAAPPVGVQEAAPVLPVATPPTGTLGFDPVEPAPPLTTDEVATDDRSFGASAPSEVAPVAGVEAGGEAGTGVPAVTPDAPSATVGILPSLSTVVTAVAGIFLLL